MIGKHVTLAQLKGGLIVSCQAPPSPSLEDADILAAIAEAVVAGGAVGIRADGPENIRAIRKRTKVPVIGIWKRTYPDSEVFITPRLKDVIAVADAGTEIVALDATSRPRPDGETLEMIVQGAKAHCASLLMADVSNYEEGLRAIDLGFDLVSTTLSGYVNDSTEIPDGPDLDLVERLSRHLGDSTPVIAEGRISTPEQAAEAIDRGAFCIVVGTAITRPQSLTQAFCKGMRK
jgi:N-acylglucosamine-6-phosphate 2-epimerase